MTQRQQKIIWLAGVLIFLLFCILAGYYVGIPMIRFVKSPELFREWVDSHGLWGRVVFVGMVYLQVVIALIPGEPLEIAAGYAFGTVEGMLLAMLGILLGSLTVFALVRLLGIKFAAVFFAEKEIRKLNFLKDPRKSFLLAFVLMTVPGTPKDLLSYAAGLTPLTVWQWLGIVAIARIPSVLTSVITGAAAGEENFMLASLILVVTLVISAGGILYYRKLCREQA